MATAIVVAHANLRGRDGCGQIRRGDGGKEIRKHRGDDRRLEGGVRPVVHRPRAKLPSIKTEAREDCHDTIQYVFLAIHSRNSESTTT